MASIPANAGTDILELCVGQSAIVPEFQGHFGNDILIAVISFSETRRN
jgi:RNA binding exosome subunit